MEKFTKLFGKSKNVVIGMIHLRGLPGTPLYSGSVSSIVDLACSEAEIYKNTSIDAVIIENMHDIPYIQSHHFGPEVVSVMTQCCIQVRKLLPLHIHCGIQVLSGGNKEALAIALAANLNFIRAEGFVFAHIGDEGFMDASAGSLLRYRKSIGADDVLIFTDIKKKHSSHSLTNDLSIGDIAKAAEFFLSDGVIITGSATGHPADAKEVQLVKESTNLPVIVGSGVNEENLQDYINSNGLIIGSHFKKNGKWENEVCKERLCCFLHKLKTLPANSWKHY
uniref:BtpA family membrane complex biogenesis protein n=3 Tax=Clastoptera arizonana TaxID=38151 RepID=A0A1B6CEK3_9HEMI